MIIPTPLPVVRATRRLRVAVAALALGLLWSAGAPPVSAQSQEQIYFPAVDNVRAILVQKINAETVRIDMSAWYLTEGAIVNALLNKHAQGVPIRLLGDRGSIFEIDQHTKDAFYRLANAGVPIRLRYFPTWYPEIDHWKATIFVGQGLVTFGSANYTPFELAPESSTNYKDETVLFTDDAELVGAFKTRFDRMWNDTTDEPRSKISGPPFFLNWEDACALESACSDFATRYPTPAPMVIDTSRLEPDNPMPPEMVWGQGPDFNNRLVNEINKESSFVDFVIYRLTVDNITNALLAKHQSGVPVRLIIEPLEYMNRKWPEFWITHANIDKLWAAGVPIKWRTHQGLTHMKMLVTSTVATNASSNLAAAWQRDHNYFVPKSKKPAIYTAMKNRFDIMWNDAAGFEDFEPGPPDTPILNAPRQNATDVPTTVTLKWNRAPFAVSYDIYLGTSPGSMARVGNVEAPLVNEPPVVYSFTPSSPLQAGTTYYWEVRALTNATSVRPDLIRPSTTWTFTTSGAVGPPVAPANPTPANGATGVPLAPQLTWSAGTTGTSYSVSFGTTSPPPQVASNLSNPSYTPGTLAQNTKYYWRVTATNSSGSTTGSLWSFTTGATASAPEIVLYASDVSTVAGGWRNVADASGAGGRTMYHPDGGFSHTDAPLASPTHYFEATFTAPANTRYRVWLRLRAQNDDKYNDSVFVQFSDSLDRSGRAIYRIGTTGGLFENLWTCGSCESNGWGWSRHAYWLSDTGEVWFANSGTHKIRVQTREDGVYVDQIVLSPVTYVNNAPGPVLNDSTIVPKPGGAPPDPDPEPPSAPSSPNPGNGATNVSIAPTLTWSAAGATSYDVAFGTVNPPPTVSTGRTAASYSPGTLANGTKYFWRVIARNSDGSTTGNVWSFTTTAGAPPEATDIVIYANDIPNASLHGAWAKAADSTSPNGVRIGTPDNGFASTDVPLASPTHYVDVSFGAEANVPYRIWLRLKATGNSKWNDAVWVQFDNARANNSPVYAINSTSGLLVNLATDSTASSLNGWGWIDDAYWLNQPTTITFPTAGTHTMRIQVREDGVMLDQIVLSPSTYLSAAPGPVTNDSTIVPKP